MDILRLPVLFPARVGVWVPVGGCRFLRVVICCGSSCPLGCRLKCLQAVLFVQNPLRVVRFGCNERFSGHGASGSRCLRIHTPDGWCRFCGRCCRSRPVGTFPDVGMRPHQRADTCGTRCKPFLSGGSIAPMREVIVEPSSGHGCNIRFPSRLCCGMHSLASECWTRCEERGCSLCWRRAALSGLVQRRARSVARWTTRYSRLACADMHGRLVLGRGDGSVSQLY